MHVGIVYVISNGQDKASVREHTVAKLLDSEHIAQIVWRVFSLQGVKMVFQISICVGLKVGKVYDIIIVVEGVSEGKGIQKESLSFFIFIDIASDVLLIILVVWLS